MDRGPDAWCVVRGAGCCHLVGLLSRCVTRRMSTGGHLMRFITAALLALWLAAPVQAQLAPPDANGITFGHVHLNVQDVALQKKIFIEQFGAVDVSKGALSAVKLPNMIIAFTQA